jgi:hypothetical protein
VREDQSALALPCLSRSTLAQPPGRSGKGAQHEQRLPLALVDEDLEPYDPAVFVTAIHAWKVGDEFLAGPQLQKPRIRHIEPDYDDNSPFNAIFVVEPV